MKRIFCLLLTLSLALLCACGKTDTPPSDGEVPEECRLYYDYADWSPIAPPTASCPWRPMPAGARRTTCPCGTRANTPSWPPTAARAFI